MTPRPLIHCDGRLADAADLAAAALVNDGHFTTLQVRDGAVQGLDLHVERLREASRALYGVDEPATRILAGMRAALDASGRADGTLRVVLFPETARAAAGTTVAGAAMAGAAAVATRLLVAVDAPRSPDASPLALKSYRFVRHLPHIKHVGTFPLFHHRRLAHAAGADDALFVDDDGRVCEGSVWNLLLWDGTRALWPQGPALRGTRERLLKAAFAAMGVPQAEAVVALDALPGLGGLACNARGVQPLASVDGRPMRDAGPLLALAADAAAHMPWTPLPDGDRAAPTAGLPGRL